MKGRQVPSDTQIGIGWPGVQEKQSPMEYVLDNIMDLSVARDKVKSGDTLAVQIRYRFEDQEWCDTLMHQASGVKLVRMQQ